MSEERDGAPLISVKRELLPQPDVGEETGRKAALAADESEEILANHIGIGGEQAVREARVDLQRTVFEELGREQRSVLVRDDLVVVPLHNERGYVDVLQILGEVGFGERLDAVIVGLAPPIMPWRHQFWMTPSSGFAPGRLNP